MNREMKQSQTVALLYGGRSAEHEVSCLSAATIVKHLDTSLYDILLIGVSKEGRWYKQKKASFNNEISLEIKEDKKEGVYVDWLNGCLSVLTSGNSFVPLQIDLIFPIIHGQDGEDGNLEGLFQMLNLPVVGASLLSHAIAMNKGMTKKIVGPFGVPQLPYELLDGKEINKATEKATQFILCNGFPCFLKPLSGGSSVGVSRIDALEQIPTAIKDAIPFDSRLVLEQGKTVRELECAIMGNYNNTETLCISPVGEIVTKAQFYDYKAKYQEEKASELVIPASISDALQTQIQNYSQLIFQILEIKGYARIDFFLDENEDLYFNEINTIPGFTSKSMFPLLMKKTGKSLSQVLTTLIDLACEKNA